MATRRAVPLIRQLYDAPGPNPWVVRLAFALKVCNKCVMLCCVRFFTCLNHYISYTY